MILCVYVFYMAQRGITLIKKIHSEERTKAYIKSKESNIVMAFLIAKDRFYSITLVT